MLRALRNVLVSVLSACLICSPLFSFKTATAASDGDPQSNQNRKSAPPQQFSGARAEHLTRQVPAGQNQPG